MLHPAASEYWHVRIVLLLLLLLAWPLVMASPPALSAARSARRLAGGLDDASTLLPALFTEPCCAAFNLPP
jgi:hypothetical protein